MLPIEYPKKIFGTTSNTSHLLLSFVSSCMRFMHPNEDFGHTYLKKCFEDAIWNVCSS